MRAAARYDLAIIGAGVTGLAAAMYAARLNLRTIVLGNAGEHSPALDIGGTITLTDTVENYPGFIRLTGEELAKKLEDHAKSYPQVEIKNAWVQSVDRGENCFFLHTGEGLIESSTLLFATGTRHRELPVPGHDEFRNKGVQYCALCDGPLYKGGTVAVVGGSDSAAKEALLLAEHANKVYLIARGPEIKAEPINRKRVADHPKIEVITGTNVVGIEGDNKVRSILLDKATASGAKLLVDAVFVAIGVIPLSDLAKSLGIKTNERHEIIIDRESRTTVAGAYAAGDVTDRKFKQAITGVAEGVVAAYSAFEDLKNDVVCACDDEKAHKRVHAGKGT
ncbi:MAG: FAD-dependent oxidoreductase [Euryarchaeota archaeon]|nr:FAD-dependent oxidoreductase [Euryarchaeota archaeon]